ncbi:phosphoribosylformylglycinamidine cyclo-ligase [Methanocella paludicola SANAE]|uniref:Phosphoribosylformylglycinamidine cyclo-ligase n=1 Tax=Methanocella paludicola (strain DSM 17711 / JCM 13418 / NBRC 101707 / SANAE) TaxID=304371 RepID=D1Z279_METPS|nr:phosphoribosylformylglycinamidine cyclo-ligase [Methanocella paludicola]BAI62801.1 phosphoribosylformylglycinamidine cyclo-ligase [Methanocella paludicola SANAE]
MQEKHMTYAGAGVDINRLEAIKSGIIKKGLTFKRKGFGAPVGDIGAYAGLIDLGEFALAMTTDGVGTKLMIADAMKKWDTVGIDCIAMNVNDLYVMGVEPLAFVDYVSIEKPDDELIRQVMVGLDEGARQANISIVGGETAALPDIIKGFDLAGTAVGYVGKDKVVTGEGIAPGDVVIGLPSSGIHSNGYSLVRKVVEKSGLKYTDPLPYDKKKTIGAELLTPTRIYAEVVPIFRKYPVKGMAHITGGGLMNLRRITGYGFEFNDPLPVPPVFTWLQKLGGIDDEEMYKTFNMGMGYVIITDKESAGAIVKMTDGKIVGRIVKEGCTVRGTKMW